MRFLGILLLITLPLSCKKKEEVAPPPEKAAPTVTAAPVMKPEVRDKTSTKAVPKPAPVQVQKRPKTKCFAHVCYISKITPEDKTLIEGRKNYKKLRLVFNKGTTAEDLKSILTLPWASHIELSDTSIQEITPLMGLKELKVLKIRNLFLTKEEKLDLTPLTKIPSLKVLDLHYTKDKIASYAFLSGLTSLEELILWDTHISETTELEKLTSLKSLTLHLTKINSIDFISRLTGLTSLFISRFAIPDLKPLAALTKLTRLNLVLCTGELKHGAALRALPLLENLALLHTPFTDLTFVGELKNLKVLKIPGTKITNIDFVRRLKKLVILDISKTQVKDLSPLRGHKTLVQVLFKGTPVKSLDPLKTLKKLRSISLDKKLKGAKTQTLREANKALKFY